MLKPKPNRVEPSPKNSAEDLNLTCYFEDVSLERFDKKRGLFQDVLYKVSGQVPKGRVLAVIGSTVGEANALLRVLGGRVGSGTWERCSGTFSMGTQVCDLSKPNDLALRTAYVHDSMPLWPTQSPAEAFHFYARLRIHRGAFPRKSHAKAEETLKILDLDHVRNRSSGGKKKGLTKKQRWLMRLGMQLMAEKTDLIVLEDIINAREDGLNEETAFELIHKTRELARASEGGPSVLLSLSSMPQKILPLIDRLLVIAKGQVIYNAPAKRLIHHLQYNGFKIPLYFDPLEHLLMIATGHVDTADAQELLVERDRERTNANDDDFSEDEAKAAQLEPWVLLREVWRRRKNHQEEAQQLSKTKAKAFLSYAVPYSEPNYKTVRANACLQFQFLIRRDFKDMIRTFHHGLISFIIAALLLCIVYYKLTLRQKDLTDRPACVFVTLLFATVTFALETAHNFPALHRLYEFERVRSNVYNTTIFVLCHFLVQALQILVICTLFCGVISLACSLNCPFVILVAVCSLTSLSFCSVAMLVGMWFPQTAGFVMMLVFAPCIVLSNFFILQWTVPIFIRWIFQLNPLFYAFNILRYKELVGYYFDCEPGVFCIAFTGRQLLQQNGITTQGIVGDFMALAAFSVGLRILIPLVLWLRLRYYGVAIT